MNDYMKEFYRLYTLFCYVSNGVRYSDITYWYKKWYKEQGRKEMLDISFNLDMNKVDENMYEICKIHEETIVKNCYDTDALILALHKIPYWLNYRFSELGWYLDEAIVDKEGR